MTFRSQSWAVRFGQLGDRAELVFESVHEGPFIRTGLSRPPFTRDQLLQLPVRERHRPDYLTPTGYVEVKGIGREGIVRLKVDELDALKWWETLHPVQVFIYNSHRNEWALAPLAHFAKLINKGAATLGHYAEGKAYFAIPRKAVSDLWTPAP